MNNVGGAPQMPPTGVGAAQYPTQAGVQYAQGMPYNINNPGYQQPVQYGRLPNQPGQPIIIQPVPVMYRNFGFGRNPQACQWCEIENIQFDLIVYIYRKY